eukprot:1161936-Pelagomonas_calceolata.AAC.5
MKDEHFNFDDRHAWKDGHTSEAHIRGTRQAHMNVRQTCKWLHLWLIVNQVWVWMPQLLDN